jgi:hypothetical protein
LLKPQAQPQRPVRVAVGAHPGHQFVGVVAHAVLRAARPVVDRAARRDVVCGVRAQVGKRGRLLGLELGDPLAGLGGQLALLDCLDVPVLLRVELGKPLVFGGGAP